MAQTIPRCVNHPDAETRIACSSCDAPICTRCMRQAAVGQKCPSCAKLPRGALATGKPIHYVKGGLAGLGTAVVGGVACLLLLSALPFGGFIFPALLGFGVGRAVGWGAQRQTHRRFEVMAVVLGVLGGVIAGGGLFVLNRPFALLGAAAAGFFALRGLRG